MNTDEKSVGIFYHPAVAKAMADTAEVTEAQGVPGQKSRAGLSEIAADPSILTQITG